MYKALVSFSGLITMYKGEEREIEDKNIVKDLLQAKYIEEIQEKEVKSEKPKKNKTSS